ncbi:MAG: type II toxin-antitoxin system RelE/ParE family toxin [Acidobacteria bacterium]|nr:type II toxin-antitoxin system RelE/ParE family toxin [Acidobacteriota bacterium]
MSARFTITSKADRDLDDIADDLVGRASIDVAIRFLAAAEETFALVATQPDRGWRCRLSHADLQAARVFRLAGPFDKYLMFYVPSPGHIKVLRVLHGAQDIEERLGAEGVV